ncbi:hydrolase [Motilimonas sp. E26]|uniref:hydrolase n=1 Tax=Motilimonas sp. E26 TaxID=2865674 RepID=UPI001E61E579|nr:hydrolase [Motilimonas sp. E26]
MVDTFQAPLWCANAHLQTLLPTFLNRQFRLPLQHQTLTTPDHDFLDLIWTERPQADFNKPIVIIFHGLEGSINSPYAQGMMSALKKAGWIGLLMHFRGCSGRPNLRARSYHSGETADARFLINWLQQQYPAHPLMAIGYSLGGNMLLNLLAEPQASGLIAAVSVSAPLRLDLCSARLQQGFSRVYQHHLLSRMKKNLNNKVSTGALAEFPVPNTAQLTTFHAFDETITAPLHGFASAAEYYQKCSAFDKLTDINTPCLLIHAKDDPFMTPEVIPRPDQVSALVELAISKKGGHVGFVQGNIQRPTFWLEQTIPTWLSQFSKSTI